MAGGRPPVFKDGQALIDAVDNYFKFIEGESHFEEDPKNKRRKIRVWDRYPENPSITALALYLGFDSRQSIYDYEKKGKFSYTIKRARLKIEAAYEQALLSKGYAGAIFALKNFGWSDKSVVDVDLSNKGKPFSLKDLIDFEE